MLSSGFSSDGSIHSGLAEKYTTLRTRRVASTNEITCEVREDLDDAVVIRTYQQLQSVPIPRTGLRIRMSP